MPTRYARILAFLRKYPAKTSYLLLIGVTVLGLSASLFNSWQNRIQPATVSLEGVDTSGKIPGWWYQEYFGEAACDDQKCMPDSDPDSDQLTNEQELFYKTNPVEPDTNKNGVTDGQDVAQGFDPSKEGQVTFEQASSDDAIFGESILYGDEIKNILNEIVDPTKLALPEVNQSTLKISEDSSVEAMTRYMSSAGEIIKKEFTGGEEAKLKSALEYNDAATINDLKMKSAVVMSDLKQLTVPREALKYHVYTIMMFELYPIVIDPPAAEVLADEYNPLGNIWYEKTQTYAVVMQKLGAETNRLQNKYQ